MNYKGFLNNDLRVGRGLLPRRFDFSAFVGKGFLWYPLQFSGQKKP
jgi:hypothetical protein